MPIARHSFPIGRLLAFAGGVAATVLAGTADAAPRRGARRASPSSSVNLVQPAWTNPAANMAPGQTSPGYSRHPYIADRVIPLRLREAMNTTIRFPASEVIEDVYTSDPTSFEAIIPRANVVMVRVIRPGTDGNLVAMGASGNLYQFYIKGEAAQARQITDVLVDIVSGSGARSTSTGRATSADLQVEADWLRRIGFRPENIVHDLAVYVPEDDSAGIPPERVFRDGQFTYVDYGANADAINEWPVAALVLQGVETPVNVRTAGPNGRMLVVEGIGDIVLRNGRKIVCIKQNRAPAIPAPGPGLLPRPAVQLTAATLPPAMSAPTPAKLYLLELGAGDQRAMETQFIALKSRWPDILGQMSALYPPAATPGLVSLHVGRFATLTGAIDACRTISAAGQPCAVRPAA